MNEQITLSGFEPPYEKELTVYEKLLPTLREAADSVGGNSDSIAIKHGKNYSSIRFDSFLAFRLCLRDVDYIEVPIGMRDIVAPLAPPSKQKMGSGNFWQVSVDAASIVNGALALGDVIKATVDRIPKEWDCCSRYMECSDAKTCVHPDKKSALLCGYRRILNSGRIFYGKNRNI